MNSIELNSQQIEFLKSLMCVLILGDNDNTTKEIAKTILAFLEKNND